MDRAIDDIDLDELTKHRKACKKSVCEANLAHLRKDLRRKIKHGDEPDQVSAGSKSNSIQLSEYASSETSEFLTDSSLDISEEESADVSS